MRCRRLNFKPPRPDGRFVLLWVQSAQRAKHNEALEFAAQRANERGVPLLAVFAGTGGFPHANERHLAFMYEGLCELRETLETERGVRLLAFCGDPGEVILAASARATEVVVDAGYVRVVRKWRQRVATGADCRVTEVESEVVIRVCAGRERGATRAGGGDLSTESPRAAPRLDRSGTRSDAARSRTPRGGPRRRAGAVARRERELGRGIEFGSRRRRSRR